MREPPTPDLWDDSEAEYDAEISDMADPRSRIRRALSKGDLAVGEPQLVRAEH
ncbi:MAG: hypothetical protein QOH53_742 [Ilumatobacteraceae bacterium]